MTTTAEELRESKSIARTVTKKYGIQFRSALYLNPIVEIPGSKTPIRQPEDDGLATGTRKYPKLPTVPRGEGGSH